METNNLLVVLTGKTASGKDTVAAGLLSKFPSLHKIITTTSRPPRPGEKQGVDYDFITENEFRRKIDKGEFIEYVSYGGNLYGTKRSEISDNLKNNLLWRIDPSRAGQIRDFIKVAFEPDVASGLIKKVVVIYLNAPGEVVLRRLKQRGIKNEEIEKRMREDSIFWQQYQSSYDYVVENIEGQLDETLDKIVNIIENHRS